MRDKGVGFDMSFAEKLFEPFQLHLNVEFPGIGIGRSLARCAVWRDGDRSAEPGAAPGRDVVVTMPQDTLPEPSTEPR